VKHGKVSFFIGLIVEHFEYIYYLKVEETTLLGGDIRDFQKPINHAKIAL